jgi:hypothetical protein
MIWIKESAVKLGALTMLPSFMGDSVCIGADYHVTWSPPSPHSLDHAGTAAPAALSSRTSGRPALHTPMTAICMCESP